MLGNYGRGHPWLHSQVKASLGYMRLPVPQSLRPSHTPDNIFPPPYITLPFSIKSLLIIYDSYFVLVCLSTVKNKGHLKGRPCIRDGTDLGVRLRDVQDTGMIRSGILKWNPTFD